MKRIDLIAISGMAMAAAAVALPAFVGADRTYNERQAITSLKVLTTAEADIRSNDRDGNRTMDFWTADVYALYGMIGITGSSTTPPPDTNSDANAIKLIERSLAAADGRTDHTLYGNLEFNAAFEKGRTKRGYFFRALHNEVTGGASTTLLNDTDGAGQFYLACHDQDRFAFAAFPASLKTGRFLFAVNEDNTIWEYALPAAYIATFQGAAGVATDSTSTTSGKGLAEEFTMNVDLEQGTFPGRPGAVGLKKIRETLTADYDTRLKESTLTLTAAIDAAMKEARDGVAVSAALEEEDGKPVFVVEVAQKDNTLDVRVDAKGGAILSKTLEYENWTDAQKSLKVTLKQAIEAAQKSKEGTPVAVRLFSGWRERDTLSVVFWHEGKLKGVGVEPGDGSVIEK